MMKLMFFLLLLALPLSGKEDKDKIPQEEKDEQQMAKVPVTLAEYRVRNIGKADPRFSALHKEIEAKGTTLTIDELYSRLLAGETFKIERAQPPVVCKGCNGFGKVPDKGAGYRRGDGKVPCSACRGYGKVIPIQPLVVRW